MSYYMAVAYAAARRAPELAAEAKPASRKRARHPAGTEQAGEFKADDPATPDVNEAFEQE